MDGPRLEAEIAIGHGQMTRRRRALITPVLTPFQPSSPTRREYSILGQRFMTTVSPASPIVDGTFGAGPYARPGGALTVDVGNPSLDTQANPFDFSYGSGSNLRFIAAVDPTSPTTLMQLPGQERDGPEGVFASSPDLIGQYAQNLYFPFLYSAQIAQGAVETQTFTAASAASGSRTR